MFYSFSVPVTCDEARDEAGYAADAVTSLLTTAPSLTRDDVVHAAFLGPTDDDPSLMDCLVVVRTKGALVPAAVAELGGMEGDARNDDHPFWDPMGQPV